MSFSAEIFIATTIPLDDFARELESLLGIELEHFTDDYDTWHEFKDQNILLIVGEHDFERDRDMHFDEYRYGITVWGTANDPVAREEGPVDFARSVFKKLKATKKYPLMLTRNLDMKLDEYHPNEPDKTASAAPEQLPLSEPQQNELDKRIETYSQNPDAGASWQQVQDKIKGPFMNGGSF